MPEALKLYHAPASPNSRRVRMFLAEKGISVPLVSVDLGAGEQHGDAYRAINPRRVVPTLVLEDGTAIGEVLAMWRYLEEAYPATPLPGTTPKDKALATICERRAELGFATVMEGVRNAAPRLAGRAIAGPHEYAQIPALVERSKLRVANFYSDMYARLAEGPFVAGEHFSAPDITTLVTVDFATRALNMPIPTESVVLKRVAEDAMSKTNQSKNLLRSLPDSLRYEHGLILAEGDYAIVHGRFSGNGRPAAFIATDIIRIENGRLAEHWDVLQDEATQAESKSGLPNSAASFPRNRYGSVRGPPEHHAKQPLTGTPYWPIEMMPLHSDFA